MYKKHFSLLTALLSSGLMWSQCVSLFSVESDEGYTVSVSVAITHVVPTTDPPCQWGFNFNLGVDYDIRITGPNAPSSLYTLQLNLACTDGVPNHVDLPNNGGQGSAVSGGSIWTSHANCVNPTPDDLGCNEVTLIIQGPGIKGNQPTPDEELLVISEICTAGALPVELVSFSAEKKERFVNLSWKTASELNNDFFEVQRSEDGSNWEVIGTVDGAGTTTESQEYSFQDNDFQTANLVYYRLRQVDFDGSADYSEIRSVQFGEANWTLAPNPAKEFATIRSNESLSADAIQIFDFTGRLISSSNLFQVLGEQIIKIDTRFLNAGIYLIHFNGKSEKLVVEK